MQDIKATIELRNSTLASRPGSGKVTGEPFFATDTDQLFVWNGTAWVQAGGVSAASVTIADLASVEGNGTKVQLTSQGTTVNGDVVTYDGNGNVQDSGTPLSSLAPLASPSFTGVPTAPTQVSTDNSTKLATTAYVTTAVAGGGGGTWGSITGTLSNQTDLESALTLLAPKASPSFTGAVAITDTAANPDLTVQNTTAATATVAQSSPTLDLTGSYWNGSASATDEWAIQDVVGNGANGTSALTFTHSGTTGLASVAVPQGSHTTAKGGGLTFTGATAGLAATGDSLYVVGSGYTSLNLTAGGTLIGGLVAQTSGGLSCLSIQAYSSQTQVGLVAQMTTAIPSAAMNYSPAAVALGNGQGMSFSPSAAGTLIAVGMGFGGTANAHNDFGDIVFSPASGSTNLVACQISPQIKQSGTANGNYTALLVNAVETSVLGTSNKLLDLQVSGTSKLSVDNKGSMLLGAAAAAPTSAGTAGTAGQIIYYGGALYFCSVSGAAGSATWNKMTMSGV